MRFIVMHKTDPVMEAGGPPDKDIITKMGGLIGESLRSKVFVNGAGLHPSKRRVRVRAKNGDVSVERGPYAGRNELVSRMLLVRTADEDAAVAVARRFAVALGGDAELEVGPVVEPWDLTGAPKPGDVVGAQFLLLIKGDTDTRPSTRFLEAELTKSGVLIDQHVLGPLAKGKRLPGPRTATTKATWTDGPFAESKELVAGFSILEVPSLADAVAWADRYAAILLPNEVDVRPMD